MNPHKSNHCNPPTPTLTSWLRLTQRSSKSRKTTGPYCLLSLQHFFVPVRRGPGELEPGPEGFLGSRPVACCQAGSQKTCSQIHSPWLGDIVDSGKGLSYHTGPPAYVAWRDGRYDSPKPELSLSPQSGTMNLATELCTVYRSPVSTKKFHG
jgi:hypothetical protein